MLSISRAFVGTVTDAARRAAPAVLPCLAALAAPPRTLPAQERLVGGVSVAVSPQIQMWSFNRPVGEDSLRLRAASQLAVPVALRVPLGGRLTVDASAAFVRGAAELTADTSDVHGAPLTRRLDGPTDLRVRVTGHLVPNKVLVTLGLNAPTGVARLNAEQLDAARVLGAPALDFRTPVLGGGRGATAGLVLAQQFGSWSWAAGSAYEWRSVFTAVEAEIAGVRSATDLLPGRTVHLSLGTTKLSGESRVSFAVAADLYGPDQVVLTRSDAASADRLSYRLGPTVTATLLREIGSTRIRDFTFALVNRYRAPFRDEDGQAVAGSWGDYADMSLGGVAGPASRTSFLFAINARYQTGLAIDNTVTTMGFAGGGAKLGLSIPAGAAFVQPYVQGQIGLLDPHIAMRSVDWGSKWLATGLSAGLTLGSR